MESADNIDNKFQLHICSESGLGREETEDALVADMPHPATCSTDAVTTLSVSNATLTNGDSTANHILQGDMTTPVLVLTSQRGTVQASVLLNSLSRMPSAAPWTPLQLSSLHSLAQANLISDTQEQIAKQLSEQGETTMDEDKKLQRSSLKTHSTEKPASKVNYANDLRADPGFGQKKQIAIIEPRPSEPKTLVCDVDGCGRKFAWQAHYKYHQLAHTNDRRFVCDHTLCGKRFLTAQRLQVHMRTHTGERPYICQAEDCGKSFTTAGNLKNHSRVHTGERPFVCETAGCGRCFAEYSSLHKHSLTHSGAKPFSCEICGKKFSQSGSRRVHVNRHKLEDSKKLEEDPNAADLRDVTVVDDNFKSIKAEPPSDVLVLCNSSDDNIHYQDLQNAEPVVFPQGMTEHIVTVTTQPADGEARSLEMTCDILGAEEVLVDSSLSDARAGSNVVVLSQPSHMDDLHASLSHSYHHHHHNSHHVLPQSEQQVDYDHSQLLHSDLHHEEITTSHHHVLSYPSLDPSSQHSPDDQTVAEEIEVGVSTSHPQSGDSIHMDPMMECDDEYEPLGKPAS